MRVAREGAPFIAIVTIVLVGVCGVALMRGGWWWTLVVAWVPIAVWVPAFFRDPARPGPRGAHLVISPADGKIACIDEVDEPAFCKGRARRVAVFMNVFNVHVNRYPTDGTVAYRQYRPGRFFNATLDKASDLNEQMSLGVTTSHGPVLVRQIAGLIARRIVTDHQPGQAVRQGERLGLIRFGSRVEVFLPTDAEVAVHVGQFVKAGCTILGGWKP